MVVLYYLLSMDTNEASQNSLYIILFSQAASTIRSVLTMDLAQVSVALIIGMVVIICINIYNIAKYTGLV